jgi:four helix bundle protein
MEKSFDFSLQVIELYKIMISKNEYVLSRQLLKSSTSIGANVEEASAAQSRKDFISKMTIASKEARETRYWLKLLNRSQLINYNYENFLKNIDEMIRILTAIVKTSEQKLNRTKFEN